MTRSRKRGPRIAGGARPLLTAVAGAWLGGLLFAVALTLLTEHRGVVVLVDDGGQLVAACAATVLCAAAARSGVAGARRPWGLLAVGTGCWAGGQAVWSVYEVVLGREVPFPSLADAGFLLFPVVASAGLLRWVHHVDRAATRTRDVLDGVVIAGSLLALSWATTLGSVVATGGQGRLALLLSLAYPIGDVVMATLALLAVARARSGHRGAQLLVAAGLAGLAVADSAYLYLATAGTYSSGNQISAGWLTGFLLIAAGAHHARRTSSGAPGRAVGRAAGRADAPAPTTRVVSRLGTVLPYLPLVLAEATVIARVLSVPGVPLVDVGLGGGLLGLVLVRQLMALTENRRLLGELATAQDRLRHLALHDPLTGLANRVLFSDRLQHALALRHDHEDDSSTDAGTAVLFCDVDDFKAVNDELGHGAGDEVLLLVTRRFREVLRPGDTVARLEGDEFAVLLEGPQEALQVAERLVAAVARPFRLQDGYARVTVSVGVAVAGRSPEPADGPSPPEQAGRAASDLLRRADAAMYAAKADGKGRAVLLGELPADWEQATGRRPPPLPGRADPTSVRA